MRWQMSRIPWRRGTLAFAVALLLVAWSGLAEGQGGKGEDKDKGTSGSGKDTKKSGGGGGGKAAQPATALSLEQMLAQALKNHADIRVAEAKLREAEALLEQSRLLVSQKVIAHYHAVQAQKAAVEASQIQMDRVARLAESKAISAEEISVARQAYTAAKAKLAELEAQTPLLIGKPAASAGTGSMGGSLGSGAGFGGFSGGGFSGGFSGGAGALGFQGGALGGGSLGVLGGSLPNNPTGNKVKFWEDGKEYVIVTDWSKSMTPQGSLAERLRKGLDAHVTFEFKDRSLSAILEEIKAKLGVPLVKLGTVDETKFKQLDARLTLELRDVPLGAVIQAVEDLARVHFAVREYGVLVTGSDPQHDVMPSGATSLHEFWKRPTAKESDVRPVGTPAADKDKTKSKTP